MKNALAAAAALLALVTAVWAQTPGTPDADAVFVGGTPIIRVRVGAAGYSPDQRAEQIQERVNQILATGPIRPSDVTVNPLGNEATVNVKGQLLFTADWATARFNQTTHTQLANEWADHMRRVLPSLTHPKQ